MGSIDKIRSCRSSNFQTKPRHFYRLSTSFFYTKSKTLLPLALRRCIVLKSLSTVWHRSCTWTFRRINRLFKFYNVHFTRMTCMTCMNYCKSTSRDLYARDSDLLEEYNCRYTGWLKKSKLLILAVNEINASQTRVSFAKFCPKTSWKDVRHVLHCSELQLFNPQFFIKILSSLLILPIITIWNIILN